MKHILNFIKKLQIIDVFFISLIFLPTLFLTKHSTIFAILLFSLIVFKISKPIFKFFLIYILSSQLIYTHIYHHWGYKHISSRIEVIFESPMYEVFEYFTNFIDIIDILLILHIIIIFIIGRKYQFLNDINTSSISTKSTTKISKQIIASALLIVSMLKIPPTNIVNDIYMANKRNLILKNRLQNIKNLTRKTAPYKISKNTTYSKIIIIIGESASKHHMSIYSYNKNTTPFLNKLHPYIYNAISPANLTRYSVPIIISDIQINNWNDFFNSQSLVSTLKQADYKTYWISNQKSRGMHDTLIASLAHEANEVYFLNQTAKQISTKDSIILKQLSKLTKHKNKKEAFFIHIMGSHFNYSSRYEQNIALKKATNIFEEYDNTIFYTDYIISKIYNYFHTNYNNENILMVYFSDHGEVISKNKYGHSFSPSYKEEYEIPFIIYSSKKNKFLDTLKNKNNKPINLESLEQIIVNTLNGSEKYKVSYNTNVVCVTPSNIVNYNKLKRFRIEPSDKL